MMGWNQQCFQSNPLELVPLYWVQCTGRPQHCCIGENVPFHCGGPGVNRLSSHRLMDIWIVSSFWLSWEMLLHIGIQAFVLTCVFMSLEWMPGSRSVGCEVGSLRTCWPGPRNRRRLSQVLRSISWVPFWVFSLDSAFSSAVADWRLL